jgi:Ca-activated chloride channel family protein
MSGQPLAMCRLAMRAALSSLRPVDTFNVVTFAGSTGTVFERPRPANDTNLREAFEYVDQMVAGGGTYMGDAVAVALTPEVEQGRSRYVFFLTDGYVGNEGEIMASAGRFVEALEARQQQARVFGFGVGSSVNRYLLEGLSREGRGIAVYATNREDPARAVNRFFRYVDRSVLRDVAVDWADLGATEVVPVELPDLFASHALVLHGRYGRLPTGALSVRGRTGRDEVRLPVTVRPVLVEGSPTEVLGALWARGRVTDLEEDLRAGQPTMDEITRLGLEHHLVTQFTSLVAVDRSRRVGDGAPTTVVQPVEVPEGVDGEMAGAVAAAPMPTGAALAGQGYSAGPASRSAPAPIAAAPPPEESEVAEPGTVAFEADRGPRGCHCRAGAPAGADAGGSIAFVLALVLAFVALRRRR